MIDVPQEISGSVIRKKINFRFIPFSFAMTDTFYHVAELCCSRGSLIYDILLMDESAGSRIL